MTTHRRFGRLRKLPSGRWQARYLGPDGRDHAAPDTFATKTDADRFLATIETEIRGGCWYDPARGTQCLGEYGTHWIAQHPSLRPRTRGLYEQLWRCHIEPHLGAVRLADLTPAMVRSWHAALVRNGPGKTTPAKAYRLLRTVLNTALADGVLVRTPCTIRGAGQERSPERQPPTLAEVERLAAAVPVRYALLVRLAAMTGLRWGELVALRRPNVDLLHARLHVVEQFVEDDKGRITLGPPKSDAGIRTVAVPPHLIREIEKHLEDFAEPGPDGLVFIGPKGALLARRRFATVWAKAKTTADVDEDLRFHDLRHLAATLAAGVPGVTTKDLMSRIGHSSPRAALRYQHAVADRDAAIAAALSGMVADLKPAAPTKPSPLPPTGAPSSGTGT